MAKKKQSAPDLEELTTTQTSFKMKCHNSKTVNQLEQMIPLGK